MRMSRCWPRINKVRKRCLKRHNAGRHCRTHNQTHTFGQDMNYDGDCDSAVSSGESRERSAAPHFDPILPKCLVT